MKRRPSSHPLQKRRGGIFLIMLLAAVLVFFLDTQITPLVETSVKSQAQRLSVEGINQAVSEVLGDSQVEYQNVMRIEKDESGSIASIDTDTAALNALKAEINLQIQDKLKSYEKQEFSIPIGTLLGGDLFRDRGPSIPLRCTLLSNVECNFKSEFDSAGINQTRHTIILEVKTELRAMIPGYQTAMGISTDFCIAETVIVGEVPQFYAGLGGSSFLGSDTES